MTEYFGKLYHVYKKKKKAYVSKNIYSMNILGLYDFFITKQQNKIIQKSKISFFSPNCESPVKLTIGDY